MGGRKMDWKERQNRFGFNSPGSRKFIGDNSGRPLFWRRPIHFKIAGALSVPILPGSDPLPFRSEQKRGGSFGFAIDATINPGKPAESLKALLRNGKLEIRSFGKLELPHQFSFNQLRMQLRKRFAATDAKTISLKTPS